MQVATGVVVAGKVEVEGDPLEEGSSVLVLARGFSDAFDVSSDLEPQLLESIGQADRGETFPASEILERLRKIA